MPDRAALEAQETSLNDKGVKHSQITDHDGVSPTANRHMP
jgi:hypothetical protein